VPSLIFRIAARLPPLFYFTGMTSCVPFAPM
jgi:hypothetical protein